MRPPRRGAAAPRRRAAGTAAAVARRGAATHRLRFAAGEEDWTTAAPLEVAGRGVDVHPLGGGGGGDSSEDADLVAMSPICEMALIRDLGWPRGVAMAACAPAIILGLGVTPGTKRAGRD